MLLEVVPPPNFHVMQVSYKFEQASKSSLLKKTLSTLDYAINITNIDFLI
jgi:hypothetical protein